MAKVTKTDANVVRVAAEVGAEEVRARAAGAYAELARTLNFPGFRRGKVPRHVLRRTHQDHILRTVVDELVPAAFERAAEELELEPVSSPRYEVKSASEDGPIVFDAEVAVFPKVELPDYRNFIIKRERPQVGDDDVARALEDLRQANARLEPVTARAAAAGELVILKFQGEKPPEGFSEATVGVWARGDGDAAFGKQVLGKRPGDTFALEVDYPADYPARRLAGKKVKAPVEVAEVKRRVPPVLGDDFAKDLGEDSLAALEAKVRERLAAHAEELSYVKAYRRLLDDIAARAKVPLADSFVDEFLGSSSEEVARMPEKKRAEARAAARADLGRYFLVRELARREGVKVSADEVAQAMAAAKAAPGEETERPASVYDRLLNEKLARKLVPHEGDAAGEAGDDDE